MVLVGAVVNTIYCVLVSIIVPLRATPAVLFVVGGFGFFELIFAWVIYPSLFILESVWDAKRGLGNVYSLNFTSLTFYTTPLCRFEHKPARKSNTF